MSQELGRRELLAAVLPTLVALSEVRSFRPLSNDAPPDDLLFTSLGRLARLVREKRISSLELVDLHLARIAAVNEKLNAAVALQPEGARAQARAADQALARGRASGPLHGVPITIKDSLATAGIVSTAGTKGWANRVPKEDATVVARLKRAGAIILAKTNTPEFTLADSTDNQIYGRTNNPWALTRTPGGSSGGAAALVAVGGTPLDIGSDTGNSIRYPAHVCGVAGLKPTSGRVPRTGHAIDFTGYIQSFTTLGPIARFVDDLALVLRIIAGPDGRDPHVVPVPVSDPTQVRLTGLKVVYYVDNGVVPATTETQAAVRNAAQAIAKHGAKVDERRPPDLMEAADLIEKLFLADGGEWIRRLLRSAGTEGGGSLAGLFGEKIATEELTRLLEELDRIRSRLLAFMDSTDVILCPVQPTPAVKHGETDTPEFFRGDSYSNVFNLTGWPGASVPVGKSPEGLPIGVQVVAGPWREDRVLRVAKQIEADLGGYRRPPEP